MTEQLHALSWNLNYAAQDYRASCLCGWFFRSLSDLEYLEEVSRIHLTHYDRQHGHRSDLTSLNHLNNSNNILGAQNMSNARITELEQALEAEKNKHEAFKRQVALTAMKYAREHDWCGVVREALDEIDVDPDAGAKWLRLQFDVKVQVLPEHEQLDAPEKLNTSPDYSEAHGRVPNAGTEYFSIEWNDDDSDDRYLELASSLGEIIDFRVYPRVLSVSSELPAMVSNV